MINNTEQAARWFQFSVSSFRSSKRERERGEGEAGTPGAGVSGGCRVVGHITWPTPEGLRQREDVTSTSLNILSHPVACRGLVAPGAAHQKKNPHKFHKKTPPQESRGPLKVAPGATAPSASPSARHWSHLSLSLYLLLQALYLSLLSLSFYLFFVLFFFVYLRPPLSPSLFLCFSLLTLFPSRSLSSSLFSFSLSFFLSFFFLARFLSPSLSFSCSISLLSHLRF